MDFIRARNLEESRKSELIEQLPKLLKGLEKGTADSRLSRAQLDFLHAFKGDVRDYIQFEGNLGGFAFISFDRLNSKGLYTSVDGTSASEELTAAEIVPEIKEVALLLGLYPEEVVEC